MKSKILLLTFILQTIFLNAQRYEWQSFGESVSSGGVDAGAGVSIARDGAGNLYTIAEFKQDVMVQGDTLHSLTPGLYDYYVAKFNDQGQRIWAKGIGGIAGNDFPYDMVTDDSANIYIWESSSAGNIQLGDTVLAFAGCILIKLDSAGHFVWATQVFANIALDKFVAISNGYLFGIADKKIRKINIHTGAVVSSLALTGTWARQEGITVAANGDIIMSFSLNTNMTVAGVTLPSTPTANGTGGELAFLRIDTALQVKAFKAYGEWNLTTSVYTPLTADENNNVYSFAQVIDTVQFGNDTINSVIASRVGTLLKMDSALNAVFAREIFVSASYENNALMVANNGIYLGGNYGPKLYLNNGDSLPAAQNQDNLVVKMDFNGDVIWASHTGTAGATDRVNDLTNDGNGNCFFTGQNFGSDPVFNCKTTSARAGMTIVSFNDGSDAAPVPSVSQSGNLLTAAPVFGESIQWYKNDTLIPGANAQTLTITEEATYSVEYTNGYGCSAESDTVHFALISGVKELVEDFISIYPNPANDFLVVKFNAASTENSALTIADTKGAVVLAENFAGNETQKQLNVSLLASGVYVVSLKNTTGIYTRRFVCE